jgi:hypothetical protein
MLRICVQSRELAFRIHHELDSTGLCKVTLGKPSTAS